MGHIKQLCILGGVVTGGTVNGVLKAYKILDSIKVPAVGFPPAAGTWTCSGWYDREIAAAPNSCNNQAAKTIKKCK